jgi:hypothetical protein
LFAAADLMRHGELTIFWASGISPLGIIVRLLPVCLLVFGIKLVNDDLLVPGTVQELRAWDVGYFKGGLEGFGGEHLWVEHDGSFIRLPRLEPGQDGRRGCRDPAPRRRRQSHRADHRCHGRARARRLAAHSMSSAAGSARAASPRSRHTSFENAIDIDRMRVVARPPQEVALVDLIDIVRNGGYGVMTTQGHMTAIYHRLFGATLPMLMIMLTFAYRPAGDAAGRRCGALLEGPRQRFRLRHPEWADAGLGRGGLHRAAGRDGRAHPAAGRHDPLSCRSRTSAIELFKLGHALMRIGLLSNVRSERNRNGHGGVDAGHRAGAGDACTGCFAPMRGSARPCAPWPRRAPSSSSSIAATARCMVC